VARKTYTGAPSGCSGTFTVDADVEALTVYSASVTVPAVVEGSGGSRNDTHKILVDVFGGAQMALLGTVELVSKVHSFPSDAVTGSDWSSTWVATTPYPTARRIALRGHHERSSLGVSTSDGFRLDPSLPWGPHTKPVGTIVAQGLIDWGGGSGIEFRLSVSLQDFWTTIDGNRLPAFGCEVRRKPGGGSPPAVTVAVDFLDDRGHWIEVHTGQNPAAWNWTDWQSGGFAAPSYVNPGTLYTSPARYPGSMMPTNPTKIRFRQASDPVGYDRYGTTDFQYLDVPGTDVSAEIGFAIKLGFDVSMDTYTPGTTSVTGDTPAITDGTHTVVAQPDPSTGGIKVTDGAGNTVGTTGPLPGGPVNGPITLRIDGDTLMVIYAGDVVWVYKLADLTWWNLNLSSVYVGIWNPSTHVVTPTTPTYPPLGGWRYRLFSRLKVPGIRPRLFGAWAHTWAGLTWVTDASSAYSTMGGWEASLATDPTVTVYPGGQEWLITAQEATKIAAAGGLEFLEEVTP